MTGGPGGPGTHVIDHEVHDGLWHEVTDGLVDDGHIGVYQVANGLHLALQLWIHGEGILLCSVLVFCLQGLGREAVRGDFSLKWAWERPPCLGIACPGPPTTDPPGLTPDGHIGTMWPCLPLA